MLSDGLCRCSWSGKPPVKFDYTGNVSRSLWQPIPGTKAHKLKCGSRVEIVLQDTSINIRNTRMVRGNKESKITVIVDDECKGVRTDYKEVFGTRRVIGRTRRNSEDSSMDKSQPPPDRKGGRGRGRKLPGNHNINEQVIEITRGDKDETGSEFAMLVGCGGDEFWK
ncbi:hypothetical protein ACSQ67_021107 [Phaseolus vulgaris]